MAATGPSQSGDLTSPRHRARRRSTTNANWCSCVPPAASPVSAAARSTIAMWASRCSELTCTPEASASGTRDRRECGVREPAAGVRECVAVANCLPAPPSAVSSSIPSSWQLHITSTQPCQLPIYTRIAPQTTAESLLSCTAPAPLYSVHTATSRALPQADSSAFSNVNSCSCRVH